MVIRDFSPNETELSHWQGVLGSYTLNSHPKTLNCIQHTASMPPQPARANNFGLGWSAWLDCYSSK
jgi:hypothetical protein